MRNVIVAMLFITSAVFAADEGDAFITAGLSLTVKNPEVARDMLLRGIARSANAPAKAYMELAKLSESEKDVSVSLYTTAYRLMVQDPKSAADCKFILGRLQILSKPTADLIAAMGGYAGELDAIQKTRKDEMTQGAVEGRREQLSLSSYVPLTAQPSHNLIKAVDVSKALRGTWTRETDCIVSGTSSGSIMPIAFSVKAEYDVTFVFSRVAGNGMPVLFLHKGDNQFAFEISDRSGVAGFQMLNGVSYTGNPTRAAVSKLVMNKSYTVKIQVRSDSVAAYLDGKLLSQTAVDYSQFTLHSGWGRLPLGTQLAIGSWEASIKFQSVEVVNK